MKFVPILSALIVLPPVLASAEVPTEPAALAAYFLQPAQLSETKESAASIDPEDLARFKDVALRDVHAVEKFHDGILRDTIRWAKSSDDIASPEPSEVYLRYAIR